MLQIVSYQPIRRDPSHSPSIFLHKACLPAAPCAVVCVCRTQKMQVAWHVLPRLPSDKIFKAGSPAGRTSNYSDTHGGVILQLCGSTWARFHWTHRNTSHYRPLKKLICHMNNDIVIKESYGDDNYIFLSVLGLTKTFPSLPSFKTYIYTHTHTHIFIFVLYVCNKVSTKQCL